MRGWKERTSTSPNGWHLGHYKKALQENELTRGYQIILNIPIKHGWGNRLVWQGEDDGITGDNMQGSRKQRSTMDLLSKKVVSHDISWQYRSNMAIFDENAASCYDRTLVNLAMVCARRLGMPVEVVLAHSETLCQMKYTVKTVYGISENHYCGTASHPLAEPGQGSRDSPAGW